MSGVIDSLRSVRIGGSAAFDFVTSLLIAHLIAPYLKINRTAALLLTIPLGILVHELFSIKTPLNSLLFESENCTARLLIGALLVAGVYYLFAKK